jgi:hypothetical protein
MMRISRECIMTIDILERFDTASALCFDLPKNRRKTENRRIEIMVRIRSVR